MKHDDTTPSPNPTSSLPPKYGPPISLEVARHVMAAAEAEAHANGWPVVIAICDAAGHLAMLHRLDQSNHGAVAFAQRKAEAAAAFRRPTKVYEDLLAGG